MAGISFETLKPHPSHRVWLPRCVALYKVGKPTTEKEKKTNRLWQIKQRNPPYGL